MGGQTARASENATFCTTRCGALRTNAEDDVPGEPVSLGWPGNHRVISTPVADIYFTIIEGEETPGRGFLFLVAIEDLD